MAETTIYQRRRVESSHARAPEIKNPKDYTPEEKVRVFLVADEDTSGAIQTTQHILKQRYPTPDKFQRIYDDIPGIPIATLGSETKLRRVARYGNSSVSRDFLGSLSTQLVETLDEPKTTIEFSAPTLEWRRMDRVPMLVARFQERGHKNSYAAVRNAIFRNLQSFLLGINTRNTDSVMRLGCIDWMHNPAPSIPLARPSNLLNETEKDQIRDEFRGTLPSLMRFLPYVATPKPIPYEENAHRELVQRSTKESTRQEDDAEIFFRKIGKSALSVNVKKALIISAQNPDSEALLIDAKTYDYIKLPLEPEEIVHLREGIGQYTICYRSMGTNQT